MEDYTTFEQDNPAAAAMKVTPAEDTATNGVFKAMPYGHLIR